MFLDVLYLIRLESLHRQNMFLHLLKEVFSHSLLLIHITQREEPSTLRSEIDLLSQARRLLS